MRRSVVRLSAGWMADVPQAPVDSLFGLVDAFNKDPSPQKVSLGIGAYRDNEVFFFFYDMTSIIMFPHIYTFILIQAPAIIIVLCSLIHILLYLGCSLCASLCAKGRREDFQWWL